jgi:hypothetical protein
VQGVHQRAQVRVDLVVEGAGQEPQSLPRLYRGPGQDDPIHLLGLQCLHGLRHRKVGLAGTRRTDAEHDGVLVDGIDVSLLVDGLRPDVLAPPRQDAQAQHLSGTLLGVCLQDAERPAHRVRGEVVTGFHQLKQLLEKSDRQGIVTGFTGH